MDITVIMIFIAPLFPGKTGAEFTSLSEEKKFEALVEKINRYRVHRFYSDVFHLLEFNFNNFNDLHFKRTLPIKEGRI
jgi:hypothetical protein